MKISSGIDHSDGTPILSIVWIRGSYRRALNLIIIGYHRMVQLGTYFSHAGRQPKNDGT